MNLLNRSAVISIPEADERMKGYFSLSQPSSLIAEVLPENNTLSVPRCDLKGLEWLQLKSSSIQPSRGNAKTQSSTSECKECRKMKLTSVGFLWFFSFVFLFSSPRASYYQIFCWSLLSIKGRVSALLRASHWANTITRKSQVPLRWPDREAQFPEDVRLPLPKAPLRQVELAYTKHNETQTGQRSISNKNYFIHFPKPRTTTFTVQQTWELEPWRLHSGLSEALVSPLHSFFFLPP